MGNSRPNRVLRLTSPMTPEFRVAPTLMPAAATKRARRPVVAAAACALASPFRVFTPSELGASAKVPVL